MASLSRYGRALLQLAARGWQHALLTNHVPELPAILQHLGVYEHFIRVFNSAETGVEKPHPRAFHNVLRALGPCSAVMIGDNRVADIAGAEAVGLPAVLVRQHDLAAHDFCADLTALVAFLERA